MSAVTAMVLNNVAGTVVNDVVPLNVEKNIDFAPVVSVLNNVAGSPALVNCVQPLNVCVNIPFTPVVYPLNNVAGIEVICAPLNVSVNLGCAPSAASPDIYGNIDGKLPSIAVINAADVNFIAATFRYGAGLPPYT